MPNVSQPPAPPPASAPIVTVYGCAWCEDTRRARRLLRRLGVAHRYRDLDEDLEALQEATTLNGGMRRTPVVTIDGDTADGGSRGDVLVEPTNQRLTEALVERGLLTWSQIDERLHVQNVGDAERCLRVAAGLTLVAALGRAPGIVRAPLQILGVGLLVSGVGGWCPVYQAARVSSLNGPGDRPDEAERGTWLKAVSRATGIPSGPPAGDAAVTPADPRGSAAPDVPDAPPEAPPAPASA